MSSSGPTHRAAQFIPIRTNYSMDKLAQFYLQEIVQIHGLPKQLYQSKTHGFNLDVRDIYLEHWIPRYNRVQLRICKLTDNQKEPYKY